MAVEAFVPSSTGVAERLGQGVFERVDPPAGVPRELFMDVLEAFTTLYRRLHAVPSVEQIHQDYQRLPTTVIGSVWATAEFKRACALRGVELKPQDGLSPEQHAVLTALDTPQDTRHLTTKLRELHVPLAKFNLWKKNPVFMGAYDHMTKTQYAEALPEIRSKVIGMATAGNMQAAAMVFEKTGEMPKNGSVDDVKQVVMTMVRAIQQHCTVEQRVAILADVQLTMEALRVAPEELTA